MEGKSLKDELLEHFNFNVDTPTNSSFNQRRAQILPEAFEFLFREFTAVASGEKLFRGYRLLACDGSDLCIAHNPQDETTYFQSTPDSKGFNCYQLNFTRAIHICRFFLSIRKGAPPDVESLISLISRELLPVRPGRTDPRKVKPQAAVSFLYRVA